jgi:TPP-dependent pyruvate/acetoin dehydrogenase alpha subunit
MPAKLLALSMCKDLQAAKLWRGFRMGLVRQWLWMRPSSRWGQEDVVVRVATALRETKWIFPTYRGTVAYIARGVPLDVSIVCQLATAHDLLKGHEVLLLSDF